MSDIAPGVTGAGVLEAPTLGDRLRARLERVDWRLRALLLLLIFVVAPIPIRDPYILALCAQALLYAMLALGLNIMVGYTGLLNLGFIGFFGVGAYTYAILASRQFGLHLSFVVLLPLAALTTLLLALLIGATTLRLRGDYLAIVTLGFGEILRIIFTNLDRPVNITGGTNGIVQVDPWRIGSLVITGDKSYYYVLVVFTSICVFCIYRWYDSRVGRAWIAIREDEVAALAMGVNTFAYKLLAFLAGAAFAGIAGVVQAGWRAAVFPVDFTLQETITVFLMVVIGGLGSVPGVIIGAIGLTALPELLRQWSSYRFAIYGLALIILMIYRPQGIFGSRARKMEIERG
ncbi:MAG: branched-chain amino acid ABC transporter permease [Chloroflexi bacterium]|nr:branched-chain amino acid ABC transporter permease [Chloroflexota bacterium]